MNIAIIGKEASGKSVLAEILKKKIVKEGHSVFVVEAEFTEQQFDMWLKSLKQTKCSEYASTIIVIQNFDWLIPEIKDKIDIIIYLKNTKCGKKLYTILKGLK